MKNRMEALHTIKNRTTIPHLGIYSKELASSGGILL
jgi:hypothetical protein